MSEQILILPYEKPIKALTSGSSGSLLLDRFSSPDTSRISLSLVREAMFNFGYGRTDISAKELDETMMSFESWVNEPIHLAFLDTVNEDVVFLKAARRGNSVYKQRVDKKLDEIFLNLESNNAEHFFVRDRPDGHGKIANAVFLTLTHDVGTYPNLYDSWGTLSGRFNLYMTNLRHGLGRVWYFVVTESTNKYYPHLHVLAIFEKPLDVFPHYNEKGELSYRFDKKGIFSEIWGSGNVDAKAVYGDIEKLGTYLRKDVSKQIRFKNPQGKKSLMMNWLFGKRSYSVSQNGDLIKDCITQTEPILDQLSEAKSKGYKFLGMGRLSFSVAVPPNSERRYHITPDVIDALDRCLSFKTNNFQTLIERERLDEQINLLNEPLWM